MPEEYRESERGSEMYVLDRYRRPVAGYMCGEAVALVTGCRVQALKDP